MKVSESRGRHGRVSSIRSGRRLRGEAEAVVADEPALAGFVYAHVLNHARLEDAVAHRIADRLDSAGLRRRDHQSRLRRDGWRATATIRWRFAPTSSPSTTAIRPARRFIEPVLYFKGFHAIQAHRLAHWLYGSGRRDFAFYLQSQASEVFQVDINPAVPMGKGIFIDHATGVVVGETAVIEDDVSILQNVTLGGTGKETGDRHPKIRRGVLIGAGAKILGNIEIGRCSRVAAGSVVLKPVPPHATVAGVPAKVVGQAGCAEPARSMDQVLRDGGRRERRRLRHLAECAHAGAGDCGRAGRRSKKAGVSQRRGADCDDRRTEEGGALSPPPVFQRDDRRQGASAQGRFRRGLRRRGVHRRDLSRRRGRRPLLQFHDGDPRNRPRRHSAADRGARRARSGQPGRLNQRQGDRPRARRRLPPRPVAATLRKS